MKRALLIFLKDNMTDRDVEAVARSQAKRMFGWDAVEVSEVLETSNPSEKVAVVGRGDVLVRLFDYVESGRG